MKRVKVSGKFSSHAQAVIAEMHLKSVFKMDKSVVVGPTEGDIYLPVYCTELVQTTVISALEGLGAEQTQVDPA